MKKTALILAPLMALIALPLGAAALVVAAGAPAAGQQARSIACAGPIPATGAWRPPFQQRYLRTSGFGGRYHPVYHRWVLHDGIDLVSEPGPGPVVAIAAGRVKAAGRLGNGWGNAVDLEHAGRIVSRYAHLASVNVRPGQRVTIGQKLGLEGTTGASTGLHLHLRIHIDGKPVDPAPFMLERGAPLNGAAIAPNRATDPDRAHRSGPAGPGGEAAEGGLGFPLPEPGPQRRDSLHNPPLPIPARIKKLYLAAAREYRLPWTLLAGIGMAETGHGANTGTSRAGARGLMQFLPATWATMGIDGDGDSRAEITSDADSIYSAANYLTSSGVTGGPAGVRRAILAYNHAHWYVADVLFYAHAYGGGTIPADSSDCAPVGTGTGRGDPGMPRTAGAQRDWLAEGNGSPIPPGKERPGDLIFSDSCLGPARIGHAMIWDPATKTTIEARPAGGHGPQAGSGATPTGTTKTGTASSRSGGSATSATTGTVR